MSNTFDCEGVEFQSPPGPEWMILGYTSFGALIEYRGPPMLFWTRNKMVDGESRMVGQVDWDLDRATAKDASPEPFDLHVNNLPTVSAHGSTSMLARLGAGKGVLSFIDPGKEQAEPTVFHPAALRGRSAPMPTHSPQTPAELRPLLDELDAALGSVDSITALEGQRFLETHRAYESRSNQQRQIIEWFGRRIGAISPSGRPFRVLSVGCGSGLLDVPVAQHLAQRGARIEYTGVNPNESECEAFAQLFTQAGPASATLKLAQMPFEEFETEERFELIHFVQSLYYVEDPEIALSHARRLLAPNGRIVVFHAPLAAMNQLAVRFYDRWLGRRTLFAEDVADILDSWSQPHERESVDAHLEVTPMAERDPLLGLALRDFIVQVESSELPREIQRLIDRYLDTVTTRDAEDRAFIPHPVDAFVVRVG